MKSSEVRNSFFKYFKKQGHTAVQSSSLIPDNDPTLLFTNAGMNQFKNLFLGLEKRDYTKAVSSQKCVRAGGKHNDLENVGFTARHHTFFEMLGNFSFGDYFKKEAIHFAWEYLTKELGIPKEKLYVTAFRTDDEAADIWHKQEGVPRDRIFRFDEKDNFWKMGDTGPCGPCTEIFYDHGSHVGTISDPFQGIASGEDRFVEIWNLVFMQFFENPPGTLSPLPKPSVDTGSGMERLTAVMQGKTNNYDTDAFLPMIARACSISGVDYVTDAKVLAAHSDVARTTAALRVLADHCRSASFLIADGALPSNEGRGYVLRRILRRAIRYGRQVSADKSLMPELSKVLIAQMSDAYPELQARSEQILSTLQDEEQRFLSTLDNGTHILMDEIKKIKSSGQKFVPPEVVYKLYDTYGFPADLTRVIAEEQSLQVDEQAFENTMNEAKAKSKATWKGKGPNLDEQHTIKFAQDYLQAGQNVSFNGYEEIVGLGKVMAISNGHEKKNSLGTGENGLLILNSTSFYGEGGGQVGDVGQLISTDGKTVVHVTNTTKINEVVLHHVHIEQGQLSLQQELKTVVSELERRNTMTNHSATHLLHSALRKVLGDHVTQAGSLVDSQKTRFDFTHNKSLSSEEITAIENLVNEQIAKAVPVQAKLMKHKEALAAGAMALFGEKYGDEVRVLRMGDFSCELCGGTHVKNTAEIRVFKIVSESGVSSGVRRIEAITGDNAVRYLLKHSAENLKAKNSAGLSESWSSFMENSDKEVTTWIESKKQEIKNLEKEIKKIQGGQVDLQTLLNGALDFNSSSGPAKLVWADVPLDDREVLANLTDQLKNKLQSGVVVVVGHGDGSHPIIVSVSKNLNPALSAGQLLKEIAGAMGGKGGGRPDFAQGAAPDRTKVDAALGVLKGLLKI